MQNIVILLILIVISMVTISTLQSNAESMKSTNSIRRIKDSSNNSMVHNKVNSSTITNRTHKLKWKTPLEEVKYFYKNEVIK